MADTFCGGGSIPFEAARIGCDVYASDLNPIACMLTWGAFNIAGLPSERRLGTRALQKRMADAVDAEITRLGIEHDIDRNRGKAYLYCLETRCPKTDWLVPMAPSWVISRRQNVVARLLPEPSSKQYRIEIDAGVSAKDMEAAEKGTVLAGRLVHPMNPERSGVEIKTIRGDYRDSEGNARNHLRLWGSSDFIPRHEDIFQERLYCIQWITEASLIKRRPTTFFSAVTADDVARDHKIVELLRHGITNWQEKGAISHMPIKTGKENEGPIRTNGWTHWHHMFGPRQILLAKIILEASEGHPVGRILLAKALDYINKSCQWRPRDSYVEQLFSRPSMKTGSSLFGMGSNDLSLEA